MHKKASHLYCLPKTCRRKAAHVVTVCLFLLAHSLFCVRRRDRIPHGSSRDSTCADHIGSLDPHSQSRKDGWEENREEGVGYFQH